MKYSFKDIYNDEFYDNVQVAFVLGKHQVFNNIVTDRLKDLCTSESSIASSNDTLGLDFGLGDTGDEESTITNAVDFNTFMDVIGVASILGRWYCRTELSTLTSKQKEKMLKYIKNPSSNGLLVIVSDDWQDYKELLRNRVLGYSRVSHLIQLGFPNRKVLKDIVKEKFLLKHIEITDVAIDLFVTKMSAAYDEYDSIITEICEEHKDTSLNVADMKEYMKGVEHYVLDDFLAELTKPLGSAKTNNKKVLRIMTYLEDEYGAKNLVYRLLKLIEESIEFRILINSGKIPIGIKYFFKDVIENVGGKESKYAKMNEWVFRKKADLASKTSLKDWEYMKLILRRAIDNVKVSDSVMEVKCKQALYELCTRTVLTNSRLDNILGIDNVLNKGFADINRVSYDEKALNQILLEESN